MPQEKITLMVLAIEFLSAFVCNYLIGSLMYKMNGESTKLLRCVLFGLINTITVVTPALLASVSFQLLISYVAVMQQIVVFIFYFRNPLWMLVFNITAVKILKFPKEKVVSETVMVFCYSQIFILLSGILEPLCMIFAGEDITLILVLYAASQALLCGTAAGTYFILSAYIKRNFNKFKESWAADKKSLRKHRLISYLAVTLIWLVLSMLYNLSFSGAGGLVLFGALILLMALIMMFTVNVRLQRNFIANLQAHNQALVSGIDGFRETKHEFYNILQIYEGYIALKDYEGLEKFHRNHFAKTVGATAALDAHYQLSDRPALYGLVLGAVEYAGKNGVDLSFLHLAGLKNIDMPEYDLCRILNIFLNNATEHAAESELKKASMIVETAGDAGIVIISNTIAKAVDLSKLFIKGYSTKPGHQGRGLYDANKIISKYPGFNMTADCRGGSFTVYFKVRDAEISDEAKSIDSHDYTR